MKSTLLVTILLSGLPALSFAQSCETVVETGDTMRFSQRAIVVPKTCETYKVTLKHTGKMPKTAMGHNWVLGKSSQIDAIVKEGAESGKEHDFIKPDDQRVLAATPMIGGGETAETVITVSKLAANENYTFVCTYPGHWAMMRGTLKLEG